MKLYIPTCILNLNNIFSTESISPTVFYGLRDFGNRRFEKVEANNFDNLLVLYSKFPFYEIEDKGLDNYAMVIEIETDTISNQPTKIDHVKGVGVYVSASTIYLNPFTTIIYFNDNHALSIARLRAEQSIENKVFNLYRNNYRIKEAVENKFLLKSLKSSSVGNNDDSFKWSNSYNEKIKDENNSKDDEIVKDRILNKVKGFAYCYLIGANSSYSEDISLLKQLAKRINNTLSAIVNSPDRKPTQKQDEILLADIKEFNRIFRLASGIDDRIKNHIQKSGILGIYPNLSMDTIINIVDKLHLKDELMYKCGAEKVYDAFEVCECLNSPAERIVENNNRAIHMLFHEVVKLEAQQKGTERDYKVQELFEISTKGIDQILDKTFRFDFYQKLSNKLIHNKHQTIMEEQGFRKDTAIALLGGNILKEYMGDKWENSSVQEYINNLLSNLQSGTSFDLNSMDNPVLISFAAFAQKGAEIERLTDYLVQRGISDSRLGYGLYGATEGFASLPKTFTDKFFYNNSREYVSEVYKKIYHSCFGVQIKQELPPVKLEKSIDESDKSKSSNSIIDEIKQNVPDFNSLTPKDINYYAEQINNAYSSKLDGTFIKKLGNIEPLRGTKGKWGKVIAYLKKKQKAETEQQKELFNDFLSNFIEDENAYLLVDRLYSIDKELRKRIIANLKHIQKEYKPGGHYYDRKDPTDNRDVIDHFVKWCFSDKNRYQQIFNNQENQKLLRNIQELLNSKYK